MADLILLITGLCAFVPKKDIKKYYENNNRMRVLLVDSEEPADLPHSHDPHIHELHIPVLICPHASVVSAEGYREADAAYLDRDQDPPRLMAVFYLDDQDLSIESIAGPNDYKLSIYGKEVGGECPNDDDESSFFWAAPLDKISSGFGNVRSACFTPSDVDASVISRVVLNEGEIRTGKRATLQDHRIIRWIYKVLHGTGGNRFRQVAADIVELRLTLPGTDVIFKTRLFRSESRNPRVREVFGKADGNPLSIRLKDPDKVWIKNMPWLDILGTRPKDAGDYKEDLHFAHFYKILEKYEDVNIPHIYQVCEKKDPRHGGNPNCQPCVAAYNDLA